MIKDTVKNTTDGIVNNYLRKRFADKNDNEKDPLTMVTENLLMRVIKEML